MVSSCVPHQVSGIVCLDVPRRDVSGFVLIVYFLACVLPGWCGCVSLCVVAHVWLDLCGSTWVARQHTQKQQLTHPPCCLIQEEMFSLINCKTQLMILLIMSKWF